MIVSELERTPKKLVGWQPESSYVVPSAQPEALPHSAEGTRCDGTNRSSGSCDILGYVFCGQEIITDMMIICPVSTTKIIDNVTAQ